jgi:hypothetical protein
MAEIPLALLSTISLIFLVGLLNNDTLSSAIAFGVFAAATALVKPSGFVLLMVPLPAALLLKTPRRIFSPRLWLGMALAVAIALPVHAWTLKLQREGLEGRRIPFGRVSQALVTYVRELPDLLGWAVLCLSVIGIAIAIAAVRRSPMPARSAAYLVFLASLLGERNSLSCGSAHCSGLAQAFYGDPDLRPVGRVRIAMDFRSFARTNGGMAFGAGRA